jgi:hypothetical protein
MWWHIFFATALIGVGVTFIGVHPVGFFLIGAAFGAALYKFLEE